MFENNLGKPSIRVGHLQIWIHGKEYASSTVYHDRDWLRVTAHCGGRGSEVVVSGSILRLSEIAAWLEGLEKLNSTLSGKANLDCLEPALKVEMVAESLGHVSTRVEITPDHLNQFHSFEFEIDQSYIPDLIGELKKVMAR